MHTQTCIQTRTHTRTHTHARTHARTHACTHAHRCVLRAAAEYARHKGAGEHTSRCQSPGPQLRDGEPCKPSQLEVGSAPETIDQNRIPLISLIFCSGRHVRVPIVCENKKVRHHVMDACVRLYACVRVVCVLCVHLCVCMRLLPPPLCQKQAAAVAPWLRMTETSLLHSSFALDNRGCPAPGSP